jgi:hypothetical protein
MSFSGRLEHISLVEVIQLLQGTRKSGILRVECPKGCSQLVFKTGFIVSASHLNNSVRIGEFMVERGDISAEALDQALVVQNKAGPKRRPLILTLVSLGLVHEVQAYAALQALITMTIVEVLTWRSGRFVLEPVREVNEDDFRYYYPEQLESEINIDVHGTLLDALCIYDEKVRNGEINPEEEPDDEMFNEIAAELLGLSVPDKKDPAVKKHPGEGLTAADLGLTDLGDLT